MLVGRAPDVNEAISYSTAGFSLFYGLLLGLLTVAAYQNREAVEASIQNEAAAIAALYADMNSYPEPVRSDMRDLIRDYVQFTIHRDWPASGSARRSRAARIAPTRCASGSRPSSRHPLAGDRAPRGGLGLPGASPNSGRRGSTASITRIPDVLWYAVLAGR